MKYSVIIPAYNAEKTITYCLDSIISQFRDDIELIIINDGSIDRTNEICEEYSSKHKRITYITKENEGVAIARNTGILYSSGKYILFVDSDDYLCDNLFSSLDVLLKESDYDYIVLSYLSKQENNVTSHIRSEFVGQNRKQSLEKASEMIATKDINSPWAKLYKASIIKEHAIDFTPGVSISEDRTFNIKYTMYIENIRVSSIPGYVVTLDNANSLSRGIKKNLNHQFALTSADYRKEFFRCNLTEKEKLILQKGINFCEYRSIYSDVKRMHLEGISKNQRKRFIKEQCSAINKEHLKITYTKYNLLIYIPVKLRFYFLIDYVAYRLAKKN